MKRQSEASWNILPCTENETRWGWIVILLLLIFGLSFCSTKKYKKAIIWQPTIGTLETEGRTYWIRYVVNNLTYRQRFHYRHDGAVDGEKYTLKYNDNNPQEIEIDYWNPVFEKGEKTAFLNARIVKIAWINFYEPKYIIRYTFDIDEKSISNDQVLPPGFNKKFPSLKSGDFYKVEVCDDNIYRSVLHINSPVSSR